VRKDVPALFAQLQAAHPALRWRLAPAVGESEALVQALAEAALAALASGAME
jgi:sirohydrochlorin cobaltochelatase